MKFKEEKLFNYIKKKLPKNNSFIDEISDVLDISYDAAYRRVNGKTTLSFQEALELTNHYKIPIYSLYDLSTDNSLFVNKNHFSNSNDGLEGFYKEVSAAVRLFSKYEKADILYAAKDIPVYHTPVNSLYAKFRMYAYLNILSDSSDKKMTPLHKFSPKQTTIDEALSFKKSFYRLKTTDVWSDTTINSSLYQIYYFYETKLIKKEEALQLCDEVLEMITGVEQKAITEVWNDERDLKYELYYNKLINLNNTVYLRSEKTNALLVPYTSLSHIRIEDEKTCEEIETYFKKQLQFSKKISGSAEVDRRMFFTSMYDKIEQLKHQIEIKSSISFM